MTSIPSKARIINLGYLPGDQPITKRSKLALGLAKRDVSIEHVKVSLEDAAAATGLSEWMLKEHSSQPGFITAAELRAGKQRKAAKQCALRALMILGKGREGAIAARIKASAQHATTELDALYAKLGNAFQNNKLKTEGAKVTGTAAARVQELLDIHHTLETKGCPATVIGAARVAHDDARKKFAAFETAIAASLADRKTAAEGRKREFTMTDKRRDDFVTCFTKANAAGWKFSYTKEMEGDTLRPNLIVDEIIRFGEVWAGKGKDDPELQPIRTIDELNRFEAVWTGKAASAGA